MGLALTACVTAATNPQSPTATEELLPAHAARAAAAEVRLVCRSAGEGRCVAPHARVFLQVLAGDDARAGKIAASEVRMHLSPSVDLVEDLVHADVVVDLTVAAAAIDDEDHVIGLPPVSIPAIPGKTASTTTTPEISLVGWHDRTGVVELEAVARDAKTGRFITAVGPLSAVARLRRGSVLTAISWGKAREMPAIAVSRR